MPKQTNWTCDNPKCERVYKDSERIPTGWREVLLMCEPGNANGQRGTLCSGCVLTLATMLPPPASPDTLFKPAPDLTTNLLA